MMVTELSFSAYFLVPSCFHKSPYSMLLPLAPEVEPACPPTIVLLASKPTLPHLFRVGEYILGDGDCPQLYGHPDIRY